MCRKYKGKYQSPLTYVMAALEEADTNNALLTERVLSLETQLRRVEKLNEKLYGDLDAVKDILNPEIRTAPGFTYISCNQCVVEKSRNRLAEIFHLTLPEETTEKETEETPEAVVSEAATDE